MIKTVALHLHHRLHFLFIARASAFVYRTKDQSYFSISFIKSASDTPITGRVFSPSAGIAQPEPRYEAGSYFTSVPFWGKDVDQMKPENRLLSILTYSAILLPTCAICPPEIIMYRQYLMCIRNFTVLMGILCGHTRINGKGNILIPHPGNLISGVQKIHYDPLAGPVIFYKDR